VPDDFDVSRWNPDQNRLVSEWAMRGISRADGHGWSADGLMLTARLELPAGIAGPGFLTFPNFRVIKRYNNSTAYALGVAHLADRISGAERFIGPWPAEDVPLTRTQTREMQAAMNTLGFDSGTPDGLAGPRTRDALRAFQRSQGVPADGYAGRAMYDAVIAALAARGE
jgi:membrane-bound lytic murein transglycosylase B